MEAAELKKETSFRKCLACMFFSSSSFFFFFSLVWKDCWDEVGLSGEIVRQ